MLITNVTTSQDSSSASPVELLLDSQYPVILYTKNHIVSTNQVVEFDFILDHSEDCLVDISFYDGLNSIVTLLELSADYPNVTETLTASYSAEGLYTPEISVSKSGFPSKTTIYKYNNFVWVNDTLEEYDSESDRQIFSVLQLPNDKSELNIKPSDYVTSHTFNLVVDKYWENFNYLINQLKVYSQELPYIWNAWYDGSVWDDGIPENNEDLKIVDVLKIDDNIYTIENNKIIIRKEDYTGTILKTIENTTNVETFQKPISFSYHENTLLVLDQEQSMIFSFVVDKENLELNLYLYFGGFGDKEEKYKFNLPTDIYHNNSGIFVCDTENSVVKKFTNKYHWLFTVDMDSKPLRIISNDFYFFVLCEDNTLSKYDQSGTFLNKIDIIIQDPLCIHLDQINNSLFYVFGNSEVVLLDEMGKVLSYYKNFPTVKNVYQKGKEFVAVSDSYIGKFGDCLLFNLLGSQDNILNSAWNKESITVDFREFSQQIIYNDSFKKMRDNLDIMLTEITSRPVNYYSFSGDFLYRTFETLSEEDKNCDISDRVIGFNEIESYDVISREWNNIYDTMECVTDIIQTKNRHLSEKNTDCFIWKHGVVSNEKEDNSTIWPISWSEMDCELSELTASELSGMINGILPQLWTFNQLRCERYNAPTWNELKEYPSLTWNTLKSRCGDIINNPSENAWENLIGDCCEPESNTIPFDFNEDVNIPNYAWTNFECGSAMGFTWEDAMCDSSCGEKLTWETLSCDTNGNKPQKYFPDELILENDC